MVQFLRFILNSAYIPKPSHRHTSTGGGGREGYEAGELQSSSPLGRKSVILGKFKYVLLGGGH